MEKKEQNGMSVVSNNKKNPCNTKGSKELKGNKEVPRSISETRLGSMQEKHKHCKSKKKTAENVSQKCEQKKHGNPWGFYD